MNHPAELLKPGQVVVARCPNIDWGLAKLKSEFDRAGLKVVALHWACAAHLEALLDGAVEGLARLSRALWPHWCVFVPVTDDRSPRAWLQEVSPHWREAAERYCEAGQLPLPQGYSAAAQAAQLVLTLARESLVIIMTVEGMSPKPGALDSRVGLDPHHAATTLRSAGEWLATNTSAPVVLLLPALVADQSGLRKILPCMEFFDTAAQASHAPDEQPLLRDGEDGENGEVGKPAIDLFPVTGTPHPLSRGEQKLAHRLRSDPELAPLFAFNQRITGGHGNQYIVDLVWPSGRLIVEVDSFQVHGNRFAFAQDRHRDYELMAANYRVLRITHDEAAMDTESAVEKIRQLVRLAQ